MDIQSYLQTLKHRNIIYDSKEELLEDYSSLVNSFEKWGYQGSLEEFQYVMELSELLDPIVQMLLAEPVNKENKSFIEKIKELENIVLANSIPVDAPSGLPWWYSRVLKKGSLLYVEGVKDNYGIDIEVV